jgi:two-component system, LytTR family, sensor kinase
MIEDKESETRATPRRSWNWAIGFAVWTIVGLSFGTRSYLQAQLNGSTVTFRETVPSYLIDFYIWGAVSPLIFYLCRKFPIASGRLLKRIGLHLGISVVFVLAITAITIPTTWYLGLTNTTVNPTLSVLFGRLMTNPFMLHQGFIAFWGTVVVAHAYEYYRQVQVGRTRASELSAELAQAQLAALKMQIHPHFLFNTLNSIATLLHRDVEAADRMIARLSDFLRLTLNSSQTTSATLGQELEFLQAYLEIEQIRFQDRLIIEIDVEPDVLDARVPNLILQPLVENAVRHGISKQIAVGCLQISAHCIDDRLMIRIDDNGPGLRNGVGNSQTASDTGLGLANTRARLGNFYEDFQFHIANKRNQSGTTVTLNVPLLRRNGRE